MKYTTHRSATLRQIGRTHGRNDVRLFQQLSQPVHVVVWTMVVIPRLNVISHPSGCSWFHPGRFAHYLYWHSLRLQHVPNRDLLSDTSSAAERSFRGGR